MATPEAGMATPEAVIANDITGREMIDATAFERSHLFLADNEMMKNDVSH